MAWYIGAEQTYEDIDSKIEFEWPFSEEEMAVIDITFAHSGKAIFYTTGSGVDTIGYLNDYGVKIDEDYGEPLRYVAYNDDSSGSNYNFRIEYTVEAGERYFLYYRHLYSTSNGDITLVIIPPESENTDEYYQPSYEDIEVDITATESSITVHVTGFDEEYDGVWELLYIVAEKYTGTIVANLSLRSDSDLSFNKVTFDSEYDDIKPGTTYQILLELTPYPGENSGVNPWITWEPYEITTGSGDNFNEDSAILNLSSSADGKIITAYISGLNKDYPYADRYIVWSLDGDPKSNPTYINAYATSSPSVTWTNLTPGQTYTVGAAIWFTSNGSSKPRNISNNITTNSPQRPPKFKWADGTTKKMPRQEFDITADEWCDLLDNINAVRKYKGYSEFPKGSYTGTSYYKYFTYPAPGQPFRYQHYNQALNAITGMLGTGYNDNAVKKGDPVTAAKINLLVEWLNGIT